MKISVSYVSTNPLIGDSPKVKIDIPGDFVIDFIDKDKNEIVNSIKSKGYETVIGGRQWFTNWEILVKENDRIIFRDIFDAKNKTIFIKIDSYALGDNIAWFPYIEEFRKKHKCNIICSTFFNEFFCKSYTDILFVKPNTQIENVYAQYYIGANDIVNRKYCPVKSTDSVLQSVSSNSLGLENKEIKPKIYHNNMKNKHNTKYVCISEFSSNINKNWKGDWQKIVDFFKSNGYEVVVISKEVSTLKGVINKSGNIDLSDRINDLLYCDYFIGNSSGLAWLAWALDCKVILISDTTPKYHEFQDKTIRIGKNINGLVDYNFNKYTTTEEVLSILTSYINR